MKTKELLEDIFSKVGKINTTQKKFIIGTVLCLYQLRGRGNFTNMARYTTYNECTIRRNFEKDFDFANFNRAVIQNCCSESLIAAVDCTFIEKSGTKTADLGMFWSGSDKTNKKGLEVSVVSLIDTQTKKPTH